MKKPHSENDSLNSDAPAERDSPLYIPIEPNELDSFLVWQEKTTAADGLSHDVSAQNAEICSPLALTLWSPDGAHELEPAANTPYALIDEFGTGAFSNVGVITSRPLPASYGAKNEKCQQRPWDAIPSGVLIGVNLSTKSERSAHEARMSIALGAPAHAHQESVGGEHGTQPEHPEHREHVKNPGAAMSPSKTNVFAFKKKSSSTTQTSNSNAIDPHLLPLELPLEPPLANSSIGFKTFHENNAIPDVVLGKLANQPPAPGDDQALRIETFWQWFNENEDQLFNIKLDETGYVADEHMATIVLLGEACAKIHEDLSVEIENAGASGIRKLVISANGLTEVFPVVEEVVDRSRTPSRWEVVKYRQRQERINALSLKGHTLKPQDIRFAVARHKGTGQFGVYVFIPGFNEAELDIWRHLGFIFLDLALGEFDVATKLTSVEFGEMDSMPHVNRLTIGELPTVFDYLFNKSRH